jgi:hypothetical protein
MVTHGEVWLPFLFPVPVSDGLIMLFCGPQWRRTWAATAARPGYTTESDLRIFRGDRTHMPQIVRSAGAASTARVGRSSSSPCFHRLP